MADDWTPEHQRHALAWALRAAAYSAEIGDVRDAQAIGAATWWATRSGFALALRRGGDGFGLSADDARRVLRRIDALAMGRLVVEPQVVWWEVAFATHGGERSWVECDDEAEARRVAHEGRPNVRSIAVRRVTRRRVRRAG